MDEVIAEIDPEVGASAAETSSSPKSSIDVRRPGETSSGELANLYERYWRAKAEPILNKLGVPPSEKEDVLQDCFTHLLARFREGLTFDLPEAYFLQTTRAACIDRLRKKSRTPSATLLAGSGVDSSALGFGDQIDCDRLLSKLEAGERQIVVDHLVLGLSHSEISATRGILPESARKSLYRALGKLRKLALAGFDLVEAKVPLDERASSATRPVSYALSSRPKAPMSVSALHHE